MVAKSTKWPIGVIVTIIIIAIGWVGYANVLAYRVRCNEELDNKDHTQLKGMAVQNHDDILLIKSDITYIKTGIDEIKKEVKSKP